MVSYVLDLPGVGPVTVARSARASRLSVSVRADGTVRAAVPFGISFKVAEAFIRVRARLIAENVARIRARTARLIPVPDIPASEHRAARERLLSRLAALAARYGFTYRRAVVRGQQSRWGSCSARGTISLNRRLVRLPVDLLDYVLLHELLHTRLPHHGLSFWAALEGLAANARGLRKRLRGYHLA